MVDIVGPDTFGGTWEAAVREAPDRDFLVYLDEADGRATYTYGQFDRLVRRTAAGFAACGIGYQTIVALQVGNSPEFVSCFLALARLGAVVVPLGLKTPAPELRRLYDTCGATWAIVEAATQDLHAGLRDHAGYLPGGLIVAHGEAAAGALALDTLGTPTAPVPVPPPVGSDDLAELLFTSGTTATPKAVMITHANLVYSGHFATWQASLRGDDRVLTTMPACHSNFQLVALTGVIVAQATLVLAERYSARRFWAQVRTERATVIQLTAMMARTLLLQPPAAAEREHLVRETLYFMPLSTTEKTAFEARYGVRFMNSYGSTESICWVVTDPPVGGRRWPAVGRAALGYEVAITDEAGRSLPPGQVGEFRIKGVPGRTLMAGYWRDPAATRAALTADGWLCTSDFGYYDETGWFYFVDRARDVIKRAAETISATEIETVLTAHPLIADAAVIGVPDPIRDQAIVAFVQLQAGAQLTATEIGAYCAANLSDCKRPQVIEIVATFPRTASQKIAKRQLADRYLNPQKGSQ